MGSLPEPKYVSAEVMGRINKKILEDNRNTRCEMGAEYAVPDSKQMSDDTGSKGGEGTN